MQENTVFVKKYSIDQLSDVNEKELWRYAGYFGKIDSINEDLTQTLEEVKAELSGVLEYKACYRRIPISLDGEKLRLPFPCESKDLARCIDGSQEIIIFAATVGLGIDRYILRAQKLSPVKALVAQALGTERIECLCDSFCADISHELLTENLFLTRRYSPGYGDLPLETQTELFSLLDCNRQIGISLNDSLLMTPSKSVTAIMGIKDSENNSSESCNKPKCLSCQKTDCEYRKQESK